MLFGLRSNINYKSESVSFVNEKQYNQADNQTRTMNLAGDKFRELTELYPETCTNLKLRSLEKRSIFVYYKNKVMERSRQQR